MSACRTSHLATLLVALTVAVIGVASTSCSSDDSAAASTTAVGGSSSVATSAPDTPAVADSAATVESTTASIAPAAPAVTEAPYVSSGPLFGLPVGVAGEFPDGTYAVDISDDDLAAVGIPEEEYPDGHGHFVWTMTRGEWTFVQTAENPLTLPTLSGTYQVEGDLITFFGSDLDPQELNWAAAADGSIEFTYLASTGRYFSAFLGSHPLVPRS